MSFSYPCFISYVHGEHELIKNFVEQVCKALKAYLEPYFDKDPYVDQELVAGDHFNDRLAEAICRSVCMIVIYFPKYERHTYCLREYRAMEILEDKRLKLLGRTTSHGRGLIIPILLRGKREDLPARIKDHIHFCDFSKFTTATPDIRANPDYVSQIDKIAYYIFELYREFEKVGVDICTDCHSFQLPTEEEVTSWHEKGGKAPTRFPLREG